MSSACEASRPGEARSVCLLRRHFAISGFRFAPLPATFSCAVPARPVTRRATSRAALSGFRRGRAADVVNPNHVGCEEGDLERRDVASAADECAYCDGQDERDRDRHWPSVVLFAGGSQYVKIGKKRGAGKRSLSQRVPRRMSERRSRSSGGTSATARRTRRPRPAPSPTPTSTGDLSGAGRGDRQPRPSGGANAVRRDRTGLSRVDGPGCKNSRACHLTATVSGPTERPSHVAVRDRPPHALFRR
jgi:hypothetical protein